MTSSPPRIAMINGICVHHDAISRSIAGKMHALKTLMGCSPRLYTYACDYPELDHVIVRDPADILNDDFFRSADFVIYHFGIYYDLFNTILGRTKSSKAVVRFHNVTPKGLVSAKDHHTIDKSLRQQANIGVADAVWADSEFNRQTLIDYGIDAEKITVEPLFVKDEILDLHHQLKSTKQEKTVNLLFVGRFVSSKGVLDLIQAVGHVVRRTSAPVRLHLAGNTQFSDPNYLEQIKKEIAVRKLDNLVEFLGRVSDEELARRYIEADIFVLPSYHEGFCVPLIEAFATGCIPLTYAAGNLESLSGGLGEVVETGNVAALGEALLALVDQVALRNGTVVINRAEWSKTDYAQAVEDHLEQFRYHNFAKRTIEGLRRLKQAT